MDNNHVAFSGAEDGHLAHSADLNLQTLKHMVSTKVSDVVFSPANVDEILNVSTKGGIMAHSASLNLQNLRHVGSTKASDVVFHFSLVSCSRIGIFTARLRK